MRLLNMFVSAAFRLFSISSVRTKLFAAAVALTASAGPALAQDDNLSQNAQAAAQYYPAGYWYSLMRIPPATDFPGTGPSGNGLAPSLTSQAQLLRALKSGACTACHQLGTIGTRQFPPSLGKFASSTAAWDRRVQSGQAGPGMSATLDQLGRQRMIAMFAAIAPGLRSTDESMATPCSVNAR